MTYLVTGVAGFIGNAVSERLLARGDRVVGVDNLSDYYDPDLKRARLGRLASFGDAFRFELLDLADRNAVTRVFKGQQTSGVVHLAAQPGVRYSLEDPHAY
ncbi:MAG: GDP-mannose 4,6-dehydratase, partial [Gammaproteobacteria bacterium]|nr:GDP-mannose 4,6-dehydratase [Gammaproteobacteria bacterium]